MEIYDLNSKEFNIVILKNENNEIQENTGSLLNSETKSMNKMSTLSKKFELNKRTK